MRVFQWMRAKSMRPLLFALILCLIPASSWAGVLISVGFAPPVLPVYVQPPCPQPGWMWTPGYWAYGPDGYYWVPGTWVPAPYEGALWTPPYWGWSGGLYVFHGGYWGPHVGYYGGVNYGFGYMGVGFAGGMWVGGAFRYNTAVMHVGPGIHNTYRDTTIVHNTTIVNNHVSYNGGPGGINHRPTPEENSYAHDQHVAATSMQTQHESAAMHNTNNYASHNSGHPQNPAMAWPAGGNTHGPANNNGSKTTNPTYHENKMSGTNPLYEGHGSQAYHPSNSGGSNGGQPHSQQSHQPAPQQSHRTQSHQPPPPQHPSHQAPPRNEDHGHR